MQQTSLSIIKSGELNEALKRQLGAVLISWLYADSKKERERAHYRAWALINVSIAFAGAVCEDDDATFEEFKEGQWGVLTEEALADELLAVMQ